jgi:hypothetical protein
MRTRRSVLLGVLCAILASSGCESGPEGERDEAATAEPTATTSAAVGKPGRFVLPPRRPYRANPLDLPARTATVAKDSVVYAPTREALESLRLGSTLVLRRATVQGVDAGNVIVQRGRRPPYAVHPGYLIAPRVGRLRRGGYALVTYRGKLRHALVVAFKRERVTVRLTDAGARLGELKLAAREVFPQPSGLVPGNFAVYRDEDGTQHALLVSSAEHADGKQRWLVLGYAAETRLVGQSKLQALPLGDPPKSGAAVWVAWQGRMVPGRVTAVEAKGLFTVRRPRVAAPLLVGADHLMPPP